MKKAIKTIGIVGAIGLFLYLWETGRITDSQVGIGFLIVIGVIVAGVIFEFGRQKGHSNAKGLKVWDDKSKQWVEKK